MALGGKKKMFNWKEFLLWKPKVTYEVFTLHRAPEALLGLFWMIRKVSPVANNQMFFVNLVTMSSKLLQIGHNWKLEVGPMPNWHI